MLFNNLAIHIVMEENQRQLHINEINFDLRKRNVQHTKSLNMMKYAFILATLVVLYRYWKSVTLSSLTFKVSNFQYDDLGLIQKWVMLLLIQLFFFDDPFTAIKWIFPYSTYYIVQGLS